MLRHLTFSRKILCVVWIFASGCLNTAIPDKNIHSQDAINTQQAPKTFVYECSNGKIVFWSKGDTTLLENGEISYHNCKNNRARAIWENAKLNGVDFRATGNEPGWDLEIRNGDKIIFISDHGMSRYEFVAPEPLTDQQKHTTIYQTGAGDKNLSVLIEGRQCRDTMSGEYLQTTVTVNLEQKKFQGCSRALH